MLTYDLTNRVGNYLKNNFNITYEHRDSLTTALRELDYYCFNFNDALTAFINICNDGNIDISDNEITNLTNENCYFLHLRLDYEEKSDFIYQLEPEKFSKLNDILVENDNHAFDNIKLVGNANKTVKGEPINSSFTIKSADDYYSLIFITNFMDYLNSDCVHLDKNRLTEALDFISYKEKRSLEVNLNEANQKVESHGMQHSKNNDIEL